MCLNEFSKARNDESIIALQNDDKYKNDELKAFEVRNSCLSKADYNYTNANLSTSIKVCQELTDELRVRKLRNQIKLLNQNSKDIFLFQKFSNQIVKYSGQYERTLGSLLIMFAPIAPLFASECWSKFISVPNRVEIKESYFKWSKDVVEQSWPSLDKEFKDILVIKVI